MPKTVDDRLKETVDQIGSSTWRTIFDGYDTGVIRQQVDDKVKHHFSPAERRALSEQLSFGSRENNKDRAETETRRLKRLTLLFHRVMCYHTHAETDSLKHTLLRLNRADTENVAYLYVQRGVALATDKALWAKDVSARHAGHLARYYEQKKDRRLQQLDITVKGWCFGMVVQWLGCKANMREFWGKHDGAEAASQYRVAMATQGVQMAIHGVQTVELGAIEDLFSSRLQKLNLKRVAISRESATPTPQRLAELIARSPSPFIAIGQRVPQGEHATAACLARGGVSFLDPNAGEFFFKSRDEFVHWFPLFTRRMDYRFQNFWVEQYELTRGQSAAPSPALSQVITDRRQAMGYDDDDE